MGDPIKHALTRKRIFRGSMIAEEPVEKLILGVKFAISMTAIISALEFPNMVFVGSWNSEIFASITGLSGAVIGFCGAEDMTRGKDWSFPEENQLKQLKQY